MAYTLEIKRFSYSTFSVELFVPNEATLKNTFEDAQQQDKATECPYWGKIWPSAKGMAQFLLNHSTLLKGKKVLELAAGLGLPSFVAAQFAKSVCCTDYIPEAVQLVQKSIDYNNCNNISACIMDWRTISSDILPDVVLLSDINYEPVLFDQLLQTIQRLLMQNVTVILSTPARLLAKPFISRLQDNIVQHATYQHSAAISIEGDIHIFVLGQNLQQHP
ncbi:MAG: methyltransferase domain-containing protein [Chitinophagaceae bacterium]